MKTPSLARMSPRWGRVMFALTCLALLALFVSLKLGVDQITSALDQVSQLNPMP